MQTKFDTKSAVLGLCVGVLVTVVVGAASAPISSGRYQIAGTGNQGLVLDTATGEVWCAFFSSTGGKSDGDFFVPKLGKR